MKTAHRGKCGLCSSSSSSLIAASKHLSQVAAGGGTRQHNDRGRVKFFLFSGFRPPRFAPLFLFFLFPSSRLNSSAVQHLISRKSSVLWGQSTLRRSHTLNRLEVELYKRAVQSRRGRFEETGVVLECMWSPYCSSMRHCGGAAGGQPEDIFHVAAAAF